MIFLRKRMLSNFKREGKEMSKEEKKGTDRREFLKDVAITSAVGMGLLGFGIENAFAQAKDKGETSTKNVATKSDGVDPKEVHERLREHIYPQSPPFVIKYITSEKELPEGVMIPSRDLGHEILFCQAVSLVKRHGETVALGRGDLSCVIPAIGLGFVRLEELRPSKFDYRPFAGKIEYGKYRYIIMAPLQTTTFEPDVLALYGSSAQIMRMAQPYGWTGRKVNAIATTQADCLDIATAHKDSSPRVILPSGGDRVFGATQDSEMIFALSWRMVEAHLQGLDNTYERGLRYPIKSYLKYYDQGLKLPGVLNLKQCLAK